MNKINHKTIENCLSSDRSIEQNSWFIKGSDFIIPYAEQRGFEMCLDMILKLQGVKKEFQKYNVDLVITLRELATKKGILGEEKDGN